MDWAISRQLVSFAGVNCASQRLPQRPKHNGHKVPCLVRRWPRWQRAYWDWLHFQSRLPVAISVQCQESIVPFYSLIVFHLIFRHSAVLQRMKNDIFNGKIPTQFGWLLLFYCGISESRPFLLGFCNSMPEQILSFFP
jgi:hypothetical protein